MAAFPWQIVIPAALSLLSSSGIFGETQTQRQRKAIEEILAMLKPRQEYMWSGFKEMDPMIRQALQTQLGQTAGWGWPGGGG